MLHEPGDALPALIVVRANRVLPGDIYWGTREANPRKGWHVEAEPVTATAGAVPAGDGSSEYLQIGPYAGFLPEDLVLIQDRT